LLREKSACCFFLFVQARCGRYMEDEEGHGLNAKVVSSASMVAHKMLINTA
jgi:hypothetical protein